jgi:8-oxo-dGTP diphosphatase
MPQSVACILIVDDSLLLIQRRDIPVWTLPGGGIDPGETPEAAAIREMEEETGLKVKIKRKIAEYTPINRLARFTHFFEVQTISGAPALGPETLNIRFFPRQNLPSLLPPPYAEWIEDAFLHAPDVLKKRLTHVTYLKLFTSLLRHPILVFRFLLTKIGIHLNKKS